MSQNYFVKFSFSVKIKNGVGEMRTLFQMLDREVFFAINQLTAEYEWFKTAAYFCARFLVVVFIIVLIWLLVAKPRQELIGKDRSSKFSLNRNQKAVLLSLITLALAFLIDILITLIFPRPRPFITYPEATKHLDLWVDASSFPSSHALSVFAIAASLWWSGFKKLGPILFLLAILVGIARVASGVHYPSDILAGALIGIFCAWLVHYEKGLVKRFLPSQRSKKVF